MNNPKFHWLIGEKRGRGRQRDKWRWTIERIAAAIYSGRSHVTQVLNGQRPGGPTRRKLIRFFEEEFPETAAETLKCLRWNIPRGTAKAKFRGGGGGREEKEKELTNGN